MRLRRGKSRPRGSHSTGISDRTAPEFDHPLHQRHGLARIGLSMSPGEHPDGAGLQARDMGALIDPPRQPRDDDVAGLSQAARQPLGEVSPAAEALREPTIATAALRNASAAPRRARTGGAESISCSAGG